jgi:hypothetical protein
MAGAYEAMRFLEIVLAGLRVATLTPRIYPSPFADRPSRHRSGACRKQAQIHEGHTILLGSSAGAPRTLARMIMNFFRMLKDRQKMSGLLERLPTAHLLPIVARTENSALPFKRQLWTKYLIPRGRERLTTDRAAWTYCRARLNRASLA